MKWVAVFLTDEGPDVIGPFDREHQATHHILSTYMNELGDDAVSAQTRYDESPTEWVVALHHPWGKRPGAPAKGGYEATDPKSDGFHDTMASIWDSRADK